MKKSITKLTKKAKFPSMKISKKEKLLKLRSELHGLQYSFLMTPTKYTGKRISIIRKKIHNLRK